MKKKGILERFAIWLGICKEHWKEIFALSFIMHMAFDWLIFLAGFLVGKYV